MERATNEPSALADLFRLDHLTTRMRRHAEGLIILSGATPGRGWRDPVPVLDVLRAAIAEVEDYVRVDAASDSRDSVVGAAVNDVIHLVAELVENATTFSPPTTRVEIRAAVVGNGFAVEIEDRGLGLAPAELAEINARLASPPEFDLANSDQLGLFVVGQLAARHGIRVSLRESPYGGTTAIVLMPHSIIVREGETKSRGPASGTGQPAPAEAPLPADAPPPPADAASPIARLERTSAFSLTGRHRLDHVPPRNGTVPGRDHGLSSGAPDGLWAGLGGPAGAVTPARGPWDPAPPGPAEPADLLRPDPLRPDLLRPDPLRPDPLRPDPLRPDLARRPQPPAAETYRGLPRRVRQASIAPQLRDRTPAEPAASRVTDTPAEERSPDETRNLFSSLQRGWQRGRVDDLDYPDDGPGEWPGGRPGGSPDSGNGEAR